MTINIDSDIGTSAKDQGGLNINIAPQQMGRLGPFSAAAFIKDPASMGATSDVNGWGLNQIGSNMGVLISYFKLLINGRSLASKMAAIDYPTSGLRNHQPIGNAATFNTGFQCTNPHTDTEKLEDAVIHYNSVPMGNIPIISSIANRNFKELRGFLPSIFETIGRLNPAHLASSMSIKNGAKCQREVSDPNNSDYYLPIKNLNAEGTDYADGMEPVEFKKHYMFPEHVEIIDPCVFKGGINPVTRRTCNQTGNARRDSFKNINNYKDINSEINNEINNEINKHIELLSKLNKDDWLIQLYYISFSLLIIFILVKVLNKHNNFTPLKI